MNLITASAEAVDTEFDRATFLINLLFDESCLIFLSSGRR
jgi:hypothetical protein